MVGRATVAALRKTEKPQPGLSGSGVSLSICEVGTGRSRPTPALLFGGSAIRLGATSDKVLTPKTRGVRSDTNLAHAPRVSWASREDARQCGQNFARMPRLETMKELRRPSRWTLTRLPLSRFRQRTSSVRWRPRRRVN